MNEPFDLQRFVDAQDGVIESALAELRGGRKTSHWMWFVFPQLAGLGRSPISQHYAIHSLDEARAYLGHPLLGPRLRECLQSVLGWAARRTPEDMFGPVDAIKLKSCLTLFDLAEPQSDFASGLDLLFGGQRDGQTLALLGEPR